MAIQCMLLTACQPPAADDYLERGFVEERVPQASAPLPSPDTTDAIWAPSEQDERILFGKPGEVPLLAVQCDRSGEVPALLFTRFVKADREAQAMLSLVGNRHIVRLPVDAINNGRAWLWQGSVAADNTDLVALTGQREFEATIPGAGSVVMPPSPLVRSLVSACNPAIEAETEEDLNEDGEPLEPDL